MPPAAIVPAVRVVPIPVSAGSVSDLVCTASLASTIASRNGATRPHRGAQRFERGRTGHLTAEVTTHAVGQRDQPDRVVDEVTVLVALAHPPDVSGGADDRVSSAYRLGDEAHQRTASAMV